MINPIHEVGKKEITEGKEGKEAKNPKWSSKEIVDTEKLKQLFDNLQV